MHNPGEALRGQVEACLDEIKDPCSVASGTAIGLAEMGLVKSIDISKEGQVDIGLRLTAPTCHMIAFMQAEAIEKVERLPGVQKVTVVADQGLDWRPSMIATPARLRREERLRERGSRARS